MGGIGPTQLIIVLVIVLLVFGTKKLKNLGSDLGGAMKGFQNAMKDGDEQADGTTTEQLAENEEGDTFDVKAEKVKEENT